MYLGYHFGYDYDYGYDEGQILCKEVVAEITKFEYIMRKNNILT